MSKVSIHLYPEESEALRKLAMEDRRTKAKQAEIIIRRKLQEEGVLKHNKGD